MKVRRRFSKEGKEGERLMMREGTKEGRSKEEREGRRDGGRKGEMKEG